MKIRYNRRLTDLERRNFALAKEFLVQGLVDNNTYQKIVLDLREYESKKNGLTLIGRFELNKGSEYRPLIELSKYGIHLNFEAYTHSGYRCIKTEEQYKTFVLFHELAHLIQTYNLEPEKFNDFVSSKETPFDQEEEDRVNEMAMKFLLDKRILEGTEDINDGRRELDGDRAWWQLVLYRQ